MPTPAIPPAICPECGSQANQSIARELSATEHEGTFCCANSHLWITKWFAERSA